MAIFCLEIIFVEFFGSASDDTFPLNFTNYYFMKNTIKEPAHEIFVIITLVSSENSDQPLHMHSLVWASAARIHKVLRL